jgi:hypothetical protein
MISESTLSAYVDGTLDANEIAAVEQALQASPELRADVDRLRAVDRALTNYGVTVMASTASFRSEVYQNVSSTYAAPAATALSGGVVATIAAVTSALVAGGLWFFTGTAPQPQLVTAEPVATPEQTISEPVVSSESSPPSATPTLKSSSRPRQRGVRRSQPATAEPSYKDAPPFSNKSSEEIQFESKLASDLKKLESRIAVAERNADHATVASLARKAALTAGKLGDRNMRSIMWQRAIRAAELSGNEARANQYRWEQEISLED